MLKLIHAAHCYVWQEWKGTTKTATKHSIDNNINRNIDNDHNDGRNDHNHNNSRRVYGRDSAYLFRRILAGRALLCLTRNQ